MFRLSFTAKRRIQRFTLFGLIGILVLTVVWICWLVWIGRYVVYSQDGAKIDIDLPQYVSGGQLAVPPGADETVPVYINEGSDAINTSKDMTQINGYYIDTDTLQNEMENTLNTISTLPSGTAVMVELKNIWGTFLYSSTLSDATVSTKLDTTTVDNLITEINSKNLYSIAMIPAFRERYYCLNHSSAGLEVTRRTHLWEDADKCYWLDPTDNSALNWIMSIVDELKSLGFDEVVFTEFRMPDTDGIYFNGDRAEAIAKAASTIVTQCGSDGFVISFMTDDSAFTMPEGGNCRIYLQNVSAKDAGAAAARLQVPDQQVNIVFIANTNDTRYDAFSALRPITLVGTK